MDDSEQIVVNLKGPRGPADLDDFALVVSTLRNSLRNVARCVTGNDEVTYDVEKLEISSAIVAVAPAPDGATVGSEVAAVYRDTINCLQNGGHIDDRLDWAALYALNGYSSIARKQGTKLSVGNIPVTVHFADRIASILKPDIRSYGSATGRLEGFTIHNGDKFILYPPVEGESVDCIFDRSALEEVLRAVDKTVTVYGKMHYAKAKAFPVRCEVETFSVSPSYDELPTLLNACGSLRLASSSVDTVRETRNAW